MSIPLKITYDRSLGLKSKQASDTIYVSPSDNLVIVLSKLNNRITPNGDAKLNAASAVLVINETSSGYSASLTGNDTLLSKGFVKVTKKDTINTATLRKKGASGDCIIL